MPLFIHSNCNKVFSKQVYVLKQLKRKVPANIYRSDLYVQKVGTTTLTALVAMDDILSKCTEFNVGDS